MRKNKKEILPPWAEKHNKFSSALLRFVIHLALWVVMIVVLNIGFSSLFDTPLEYRMLKSTEKLNIEYKILSQRFDSLHTVVENIEQRDANVFKILFESDPYDLEKENEATRWKNYERLFSKTNMQLGDEFLSKLDALEKQIAEAHKTNDALLTKVQDLDSKANNIPAIQPVINNDLTLLAASYGMRIQPFFKTLASHQGVDFSVPENSRVFATADGTVVDIISNSNTSGLTITIDHGNGYKTSYSHLAKSNVSKRQSVRRGDIIALSGNSGLSFAPHLHYEVIKDGMRVDPIHYFFKELTPQQYKRMMLIAQTGMQSLD